MPGTISVKPVVLPAPGRGDDLQVRVSAPVTGSGLPIVVLAHGFGGSMTYYDPLVDFWTANGVVVVQPTFLDSRTLDVTPEDPRYADIWRFRVQDVQRVLDDLDVLLAAVPGLPGRASLDRIAVAGHSWGAQTVGMLLGARVLDADGRPGPDLTDPRVKAGVLLAATGFGGDDLTPFAQEHFGSFMSPDFAQLATPFLAVAGDADQSLLGKRGPDWFTDVFHHSPGARALLTLFGGEHSLGGIHGYHAADTTDENPGRVAVIRRVALAFLLDALGVDDLAWKQARTEDLSPEGRLDLR